jgi:16S rRNA (adenine1518-N6/adenine1519-N6)-dimethyltransferase
MIKSQVIEYLSKHNFHPSKKMGQNFLIEENVAKKLVSYIDFKNVDVIVEVGPGLGQLTEQLVQKNIKVICIELDKRLSEHIKTKFLNVELINDDILNVDLFNLLKQYKNPILVSNLPYSISSLMIKKFLQQDKIKNFYCLLQKEYVNRLKATNNNAEYNSLSALTQFYTSLNVLVDVSKNNFIPEPQVDSTFISLKKNNNK